MTTAVREPDQRVTLYKLLPSALPVVKAVNDQLRTVTHSITAKVVDRDGDVVMPRGGRINDYLKNPVVFFNHRSWADPPVGRCLGLDASDDEVVAVTQFAGLDQMHPQAETIYRLIRDGFMKGWSMGFIADIIGREPMLQNQQGATILEWTLLEYSAVGIPANPEALTRMMKGYELPDGATDKDLYEAIFGSKRKWWDLAAPEIKAVEIDKPLPTPKSDLKVPEAKATEPSAIEQGEAVLLDAFQSLTTILSKARQAKNAEAVEELLEMIDGVVGLFTEDTSKEKAMALRKGGRVLREELHKKLRDAHDLMGNVHKMLKEVIDASAKGEDPDNPSLDNAANNPEDEGKGVKPPVVVEPDADDKKDKTPSADAAAAEKKVAEDEVDDLLAALHKEYGTSAK